MRSSLVPLVLCTTALGCGGTEGLTLSSDPLGTEAQPIQGGQVDQGDPAVVAIFINTGTSAAICTGTLIAPNLVLSAHHCVAPTGAINGCATSPFGNLYPSSSFYVTSSYVAAANAFNRGVLPRVDNVTWFGVRSVAVPGNSICGGDVSVLELSTTLQGVCPLKPRVDFAVSRNEGYRAVGFGITSPTGQAAGTRYSVSGMTAYCAGQCGGGTHPSLEWVGGASSARGTCEGDSGGPALDTLGRVIGTVSRGPANACNNTVYESVFGNAAWIKAQAQTAAADGHYAPAGWVTGASTADSNSGYCPTSGSGGGAGGGGGSATGGGAGGGASSSGGCSTGLFCLDGSGAGDFACLDTSTDSLFPANAPSCSDTQPCPGTSQCWISGTEHRCLARCGTSLTGGGSGVTVIGGGTSGAGGGTAASGGGTTAPGGGTAAGGGGGSAEASGGGAGSVLPAGPSTGQAAQVSTGCGCQSAAGFDVVALAALGLLGRRRQARSHARSGR